MQIVAQKPHIGYACPAHLGRYCMVWRLMQLAQQVGFSLEVYPMTDMKRCTKCGLVKPLSDFAKDKRRPYGRHAQCKACRNKQGAQFRKDGRRGKYDYGDRYKGRYQDKYQDKRSALIRRWRTDNPESKAAHKAVASAVKAGILPRVNTIPCNRCGKPAQAYHHPQGYSHENRLKVVPLCNKCHRTLHAHLRHSQE